MKSKFIVSVFIICLSSCKPLKRPESDLNIASQGPVSALDYELVETLCSDGSSQDRSERSDPYIPENFDFKTCYVTAADLEGNSTAPNFALGAIQQIRMTWNVIVQIFKNPGIGNARWRAVLHWFQNGRKASHIPAEKIVIVQNTPITTQAINSFSKRYKSFAALLEASRSNSKSIDVVPELRKLLPGNGIYSATFGDVGYSEIKIAIHQTTGPSGRTFVRVKIPCQNRDCIKAAQDIARQFKQELPERYPFATLDFESWKMSILKSEGHILITNKNDYSIMTFVEKLMKSGLNSPQW